MLIIDIPFSPRGNDGWQIDIGRHRHKTFASRKEAVAFAVDEAERIERDGTPSVVINIEGADGIWRPFGTHLATIA